jgi:YihY family inner membrane protein
METAKRVLDRADAAQRRTPAAAFALAVFKKFGEDRAGQLAALIAYYGFFSIFPLLLALITLTGLLFSDSEFQNRILEAALAQFPVIGEDLKANLETLPGKGVGLAIGVFGALWAGLGGIKAAQNAMDHIWDVPQRLQPGFLVALARAALMLVTLGVFILLTTFLGSVAAGTSATSIPVRIAGIVVSAVLNFGAFLVAFRILTVEDVSWGDVFPGAAVAAVGWTLLQTLGGFIMGHELESAARTYDVFAVVIALLTWIYLGAQLTLLAAEVNVVRARKLWPRALDPKDMTEADRRALSMHAEVEERREEEEVDVRFDTTGPAPSSATGDGGRYGTTGTTAPSGTTAPPRGRRGSIGEVVRAIAADLSLLVRQQVELAKQEMSEAAKARARGFGAFVAAGVLALFVIGFVGMTLAAALDIVLPSWLANLIVAGIFLLIAFVAVMLGRTWMKTSRVSAERTKETLKEDVEWAKRQIRR